MIERLADPLVHLIRNSIDHGLETPADRAAAGKPASGTIALSARQAGGEVIITITRRRPRPRPRPHPRQGRGVRA